VPYGLAGGAQGNAVRATSLTRHGGLRAAGQVPLTVRHARLPPRSGRACGWGDPFARDPERVLPHVMEENISPALSRGPGP